MARPLAFLSYAHFDDQHDRTRITQFREDLTREIEMHIGGEFRIFQDRKDIEWGTSWKERIDEAVDDVTLFIAMITPSYFKSAVCLDELNQFLERANNSGRFDTLLPVYYVEVPALDATSDSGPLGIYETIRAHQYVDWRYLRHKGDGEERASALAQLAGRIRDLVSLYSPVPALDRIPPSIRGSAACALSEKTGNHRRCHVDPAGNGDYESIQQAIEAVDAGAQIVIHEGEYVESVVIDKPLELIGLGDPKSIVVRAKDTTDSALAFRTTFARVSNLTLTQVGTGDCPTVDIPAGCLVMTECWVESESSVGIAIHNQDATPIITRCHIHGCRQSGIVVFDQGCGRLQGNDVYENSADGVAIVDRSAPVLQGNRIYRNGNIGAHLDRQSKGELAYNEIFENRQEGIAVGNGSEPKLYRNWIRGNEKAGVYYYDGGAGTLDTNEIRDNKNSGIAIRTGGNPSITGNNVFGNNGKGVWCSDKAAGRVEGNDLRYNRFGAHWKADGCTTRIENNRE